MHLHPSDPRQADLASIVVGDAIARRERDAMAPERTPVRVLETGPTGYDARSVLVLAVVVAVLAAIVGWGMTLGREERVPTAKQPVAAAASVVAAPASVVDAASTKLDDAALAAPAGIDLAPGAIAFARRADGAAVLRVGVKNVGDAPAESGAGVLALLDGEVLADGSVAPLEAGAAGVAELRLGSCPTGRHSLVVVIDPQARVRESAEGDNASSRSLIVDCDA